MVKIAHGGTFKELITIGLIDLIRRKGKEHAFSVLRENVRGTGFEEDVEELYNEINLA